MTDGNSPNQSAFPFRKTIFFKKLRIVLLNPYSKTPPSELVVEDLLFLLLFKESLEVLLKFSVP